MQIQLAKLYLNPLEQFDVFQVLPLVWFTPTSLFWFVILNFVPYGSWVNVLEFGFKIFIKNLLFVALVGLAGLARHPIGVGLRSTFLWLRTLVSGVWIWANFNLQKFFRPIAKFIRKLGTRYLIRIQSLQYVRTRSLTLIFITFTVPVFLKKGFFKDDTYFALLFGTDQLYWIFIVGFCCLFTAGFYRLSLYDHRAHSSWAQRTVLASKVGVNIITLKIACYYSVVLYLSTCLEAECQAPDGLKLAAGAMVTGLAIGLVATKTVTSYNKAQVSNPGVELITAVKDKELAQKDIKLKDKDLEAKDKDIELLRLSKDAEINALQAALTLKEKDAKISAQSQDFKATLALKDKDLQAALALKDKDLEAKDKDFKATLALKDKDLQAALALKDKDIKLKDKDLEAKDKDIELLKASNEKALRESSQLVQQREISGTLGIKEKEIGDLKKAEVYLKTLNDKLLDSAREKDKILQETLTRALGTFDSKMEIRDKQLEAFKSDIGEKVEGIMVAIASLKP